MATSYRDLRVWQRSKSFAVSIYKATEEFPRDEHYGLVSQMRRSAVSIPSNIAEGFRRRTSKEKAQFLRVSFGSGAELETQLEISKDLGYLKENIYSDLIKELNEIMRMLNVLISKVEIL